tara:strand:+ start:291 stop:497 length:207 start_codon:yes stop_codon:yes gene_type:complete
MVEIQEFPALAQAYGVRPVPFIIVNEYTRLTGAVTEEQLPEKVMEAGMGPVSGSGDIDGRSRPTLDQE